MNFICIASHFHLEPKLLTSRREAAYPCTFSPNSPLYLKSSHILSIHVCFVVFRSLSVTFILYPYIPLLFRSRVHAMLPPLLHFPGYLSQFHCPFILPFLILSSSMTPHVHLNVPISLSLHSAAPNPVQFYDSTRPSQRPHFIVPSFCRS